MDAWNTEGRHKWTQRKKKNGRLKRPLELGTVFVCLHLRQVRVTMTLGNAGHQI